MSILREKKSGSGIGIDARVEVVDKLQEHSGKVSGKDVLAVARLITDILGAVLGVVEKHSGSETDMK